MSDKTLKYFNSTANTRQTFNPLKNRLGVNIASIFQNIWRGEGRAVLPPGSFLHKKKQVTQRAAYRAPEYNVPTFLGICQAGHFCLLIGPKNTNLVEDVEILLPVKLCWIPFSGLRGDVQNVSANQRPGQPSCFSDQPEKHKLGRGRWDLASCQVLLNSV